MASSVTITADCEGKPLDVLGQLVALRADALRETTRDAVVATAINVLSSLRVLTRVADPNKDSGFVSVAIAKGLSAGWKSEGGRISRCIRHTGGAVANLKFKSLLGKYTPREVAYVYLAQDRYGAGVKAKAIRYYIIAADKPSAMKYARERHRRRVARFAGLARWAIGIAMARTSTRNAADGKTTGQAKRVAAANVKVSTLANGFASGQFGYEFRDTLRYAALALKGGPSDLALAIKKAANKTSGLITKAYHDRGFLRSVETPFPDIKRKR